MEVAHEEFSRCGRGLSWMIVRGHDGAVVGNNTASTASEIEPLSFP